MGIVIGDRVIDPTRSHAKTEKLMVEDLKALPITFLRIKLELELLEVHKLDDPM